MAGEMGGKVDVLAVMANAIHKLRCDSSGEEFANELQAAGVALAALIKADRRYDDARFGVARARYNGEPLEHWLAHQADAEQARAAALARLQPEVQ